MTYTIHKKLNFLNKSNSLGFKVLKPFFFVSFFQGLKIKVKKQQF